MTQLGLVLLSLWPYSGKKASALFEKYLWPGEVLLLHPLANMNLVVHLQKCL